MIRPAAFIRTATAIALAAALPACATAPADTPMPGVNRAAVVDFKTCAKPIWPAADLVAQHSGTVTLMFDIDAAGKVVGSSVSNSSGHPALDEAARVGIAKCTFLPGTQNGVPGRTTMQMQYIWTLH